MANDAQGSSSKGSSTKLANSMSDSASAVSDTSDWSAQATDTFVSFIDTVKAKATGPALKVVRVIVHALLLLTVAVMALVLFVVGAVRLVNSYLPGDVWAAHLLLGTVFTLVGFFLWSKRTP